MTLTESTRNYPIPVCLHCGLLGSLRGIGTENQRRTILGRCEWCEQRVAFRLDDSDCWHVEELADLPKPAPARKKGNATTAAERRDWTPAKRRRWRERRAAKKRRQAAAFAKISAAWASALLR